MKKLLLFACLLFTLQVGGIAQKRASEIVPDDAVISQVKTEAPAPKAAEVQTTAQDIVQEPEQDVIVPPLPPKSEWTRDNLFNKLFDPLYFFAVLILGYLSYAIPWVGKIKDTAARVLVIAVILGIGFVVFGKDFWHFNLLKTIISYFGANLFYSNILGILFKTPKVT